MAIELDCVEINPTNEASAAIIWLHGLGADGHDFVPIVHELNLSNKQSIRFVFPHAQVRPVTINNGYVMPAWFDILSLDRIDNADKEGIDKSVAQINQLIERELDRGIANEKILLAGFSQGGVIAVHAAAKFPKKLAGIIALSTYLPFHETIAEAIIDDNRSLPIFMAHGVLDPVVPMQLGRMSHDIAKTIFNNISWHEYPMEHAVCPQEINDIAAYINERFP